VNFSKLFKILDAGEFLNYKYFDLTLNLKFELNFVGIKKCCSISSFFNHSCFFKEALYAIQKSNGKVESAFIQQVATRWNSLYFILKRIIDNYKEIDYVLDTNKDHRKYLLTEDEINYITSIVKILEPFEFITSKLSTEKYCSLNRVVPTLCLNLNITVSSNQDSQFYF
jgi:hypothetical protein